MHVNDCLSQFDHSFLFHTYISISISVCKVMLYTCPYFMFSVLNWSLWKMLHWRQPVFILLNLLWSQRASAPSRCPVVLVASEKQKEEKTVLEATAGWTWEWISDEWVHQQTETERAVRQTGPERPTGENMVSEPQDEEETTADARTGFPRVLMTFGLDRDQQRAEYALLRYGCCSTWRAHWVRCIYIKKHKTYVFLSHNGLQSGQVKTGPVKWMVIWIINTFIADSDRRILPNWPF